MRLHALRYRPVIGGPETEFSSRQAFLHQPASLAVEYQAFDRCPSAVPKNKKAAGKRVALQYLPATRVSPSIPRRKSVASMATRMRICGAIWIMRAPSEMRRRSRPDPELPGSSGESLSLCPSYARSQPCIRKNRRQGKEQPRQNPSGKACSAQSRFPPNSGDS